MVDVGVELPLGVREEREVELLLLGAEVIATHNDSARRQAQVVSTFNLRTAQHDTVQKDAQLLKRDYPWSHHAVLLDRCQDLVVPEASLEDAKSDCCACT